MPTAFPQTVWKCGDPRLSVAISAIPRLMGRHGFGRYAILSVPASGPRKHAVTLTFTDPELEVLEHSRHCCPQCQEARKAAHKWDEERVTPSVVVQIARALAAVTEPL